MKTLKLMALIVMMIFIALPIIAQGDTLTVGDYLLGGMSFAKLQASFILAGVGLFIKWYIQTRRGVKRNIATPEGFNLWYWIRDNLMNKTLSVIFNIVVIFIFFRFAKEYIGQELTMIVALGIGLTLDELIDRFDNQKPAKLVAKGLAKK